MQNMGRGWERAGGLAALAIPLLSVVEIVAGSGRQSMGSEAIIRAWGWTGLVSFIAAAAAQALAAGGALLRQRPVTRLTLTVAVLGWTGAALAVVGQATAGWRLWRSGAFPVDGLLLLGWLSGLLAGLWAVGVSAADWRLHRLPPWLRVVGAAYGTTTLLAAPLPFVVVVVAPFALVWWIGLGVTLLRAPRSARGSTSG